MRKLLGSLMVLAAMGFIVFLAQAQQSKPATPKDDPPVLSDKDHAAIRDTELALVQSQAQLQRLQQQYQTLMAKLQQELKAAEKAGFTLDPQSLTYQPIPDQKKPK